MVSVVAERVMFCKACDMQTLHLRNAKRMNWLMHLFLSVVTFGIWAIFWVVIAAWHLLTKPVIQKWRCSKCGSKDLKTA